jgi:hypothetical protein
MQSEMNEMNMKEMNNNSFQRKTQYILSAKKYCKAIEMIKEKQAKKEVVPFTPKKQVKFLTRTCKVYREPKNIANKRRQIMQNVLFDEYCENFEDVEEPVSKEYPKEMSDLAKLYRKVREEMEAEGYFD